MGTFIFLKFRLFMDKNTLKLITVGTAVGFALTMGMNAWADKTDTATQNQLPLKEIRQFTDVFGAIKSFYVDPVGDKKLLEQALTGMVSGLDPHSAYLDAEGFKDLQEGTEGEFGGLGIEVTKDGKSGVQVVSQGWRPRGRHHHQDRQYLHLRPDTQQVREDDARQAEDPGHSADHA